jgi:hypothetical protein
MDGSRDDSDESVMTPMMSRHDKITLRPTPRLVGGVTPSLLPSHAWQELASVTA